MFFPKCCVIFRLIATLVPHQSFPGLWFPFQGIVYPEMSIFVIIYSPSTIYIVVVFVSALFLYYEVDGDLKPSFSDSICSMRSHNSTLFLQGSCSWMIFINLHQFLACKVHAILSAFCVLIRRIWYLVITKSVKVSKSV